MPLLSNPQDVAAIVTAIIAAGGFIYNLLRRLRANELEHLDQKLGDLKETLDRTESKIDRHLEMHARHGFDDGR